MIARRHIIPVFVPHAGCPNDCVFCNQRRISGSTTVPTSEELVAIIHSGLGLNTKNTNIQLAFYGGSFTAIPLEEQEMLFRGALPFLQDGSISSLRVSTRPDCINAEILLRLKNAGVATIELGAQSMDEGVLALSGRGHSAQDTIAAARLIKDFGFELILQMMTGLPADTKEKSLETARQIIALQPDGVRIYPTVVVRDTPLFDLWQAEKYSPHTVEEAVAWCAELVPLFEAAGIPIIRLGLNPSEELSEIGAAAGAYHPAFGELVRSEILLRQAFELLEGKPCGSLVLGVHKSDVSAMIGQKRSNLSRLKSQFSLSDIAVREADVKKGEIIIL